MKNKEKYKGPTKKEMQTYRRKVEKEAKKFKLSPDDLANLYDLFWMIKTPKEIKIDLIETIKMNKMDKWLKNLHLRIEKILIPELYEKKSSKK